MSVLALGLNHTTAPLDLRGRFALAAHQLGPALLDARRQLHGASELALVSTCNRTELYVAHASSSEPAAALSPALAWLAEMGQVSPEALQAHSYVRRGPEAARHAFRVASGLDSMVLGETQILGQLKDAVREADAAGTLGLTLHQLFQRSFAVAKEVRSATEIGQHAVSMAAACTRLGAEVFGDLRAVRVLLVGAGEMMELVATHFAAKSPQSMVVANRTLERAERLAARCQAQAMRLTELPERLHEFDVVVSCTASSLPLIGLGAVKRALKARKHRPMVMVDLAVPRDIEPEVAQLDDVFVYSLDDLAGLVQAAGEKRQAAVAQAEAIVEAGVQGFEHWLDQRASVPLIQALQAQVSDWSRQELHKAQRQLAKGDDVNEVLEALARGLTQKMLHGAMVELHAAQGPKRSELGDTLRRLFLRRDPHAGM